MSEVTTGYNPEDKVTEAGNNHEDDSLEEKVLELQIEHNRLETLYLIAETVDPEIIKERFGETHNRQS